MFITSASSSPPNIIVKNYTLFISTNEEEHIIPQYHKNNLQNVDTPTIHHNRIRDFTFYIKTPRMNSCLRNVIQGDVYPSNKLYL